MKKVFLSTLISLCIMMGISVPVFASEAYVPSIGVRTSVEILGGEVDPETGCSVIWDWCEDCHRKLVVTPYFLKETIESSKSRAEIDIAYNLIIAADHVYDLTDEVEPVANALGVNKEDLVIRDVFDITPYNCDLQNGTVAITLSTEDLNNYVCLLHYVDEHFEVVPDAYVTIDDHHLYLSVDKLSPFAIVLATDYNYNPDGTVDDCDNCIIHGEGCRCCCIYHWLIVITMLLTVIVAQLVHRKDEDENQNEQYVDAKTIEEQEKDKEKQEKRIKRTRDISCIINLILCVIFYILGFCWLDIFALIADIIVLLIIFINTHKKNDKQKDEQ